MRTFLIPVDLSEVALAQVQALNAFSPQEEDVVVILHVHDPLETPVEEVKRHFERLREQEHAFPAWDDFELWEGPIVSRIKEAILQFHPDVLILGSHGLGMRYNMITGSTTEALLKVSPVPVLVVPAVDRAEISV